MRVKEETVLIPFKIEEGNVFKGKTECRCLNFLEVIREETKELYNERRRKMREREREKEKKNLGSRVEVFIFE